MRATIASNGPASAHVNPIWMRLAQAVVAATVPLQRQLNGPGSGPQSRPALGELPFLLAQLGLSIFMLPSEQGRASDAVLTSPRPGGNRAALMRSNGTGWQLCDCMLGYSLQAAPNAYTHLFWMHLHSPL